MRIHPERKGGRTSLFRKGWDSAAYWVYTSQPHRDVPDLGRLQTKLVLHRRVDYHTAPPKEGTNLSLLTGCYCFRFISEEIELK